MYIPGFIDPEARLPQIGLAVLVVYGWKLCVVSVAILGGCIMAVEEQQIALDFSERMSQIASTDNAPLG